MSSHQQNIGHGFAPAYDEDSDSGAEEIGETILRSTCERCNHMFEYPEGTPWKYVSAMVDEHWRVCPNSISATVAKLRHSSIETTTSEARERTASEERDGSTSGGERDVDQAKQAVSGMRKKNIMDENARKKKLEDDPWTTDVTPKSVRCGACGRTVSLDKRSRYYPGLWLKHRGKCMEIKRLEAIEDENQDVAPDSQPAKRIKSKGKTKVTPSTSPYGVLIAPEGSRSTEMKGKGVASPSSEISNLDMRSLSVSTAHQSDFGNPYPGRSGHVQYIGMTRGSAEASSSASRDAAMYALDARKRRSLSEEEDDEIDTDDDK